MTAARKLDVFNPRELGAKCDVCPLKTKTPVPSSPPTKKIRFAILGEAPGEFEVRAGRPFIGASGKFLDKHLYDVDLDRREAWVGNVIACRADHKDQEEKARMCCAPRLFKELEALSKKVPIIAMGKEAGKAVLGVSGILKARGFIWKVPTLTDKQLTTLKHRLGEKPKNKKERKAFRTARAKMLRQKIAGRVVLPTVHPAFILRSHIWDPVFRVDMERIAKFIKNDNFLPREDQKPFVVVSKASELRKLGRKLRAIVSCDIETTGLRYDECEVRCVGIGDKKLTVVAYPWKRKMAEVLSEILSTRRVVGHNFICFDALVLRYNGVVIDPAKVEDTMVAMHAFASHLPKSLLQAVSVFCSSGPWKAEAKGESAGEKGAPTQIDKLDPDKLVRYNACLLAGTYVQMADGGSKPIEDLVYQRSTEKVLSMGSDGRVESRSIVGWVQKKVEGQQWIRLRVLGRNAITLTPEHVVYTAKGRMEAAQVRKGDRVLTEERELPKIFLQALLGTILGDSHLAVSPVFRTRRHAAEAFSVGGGHTARSGLAKYKVRVSDGFLRNGMLVPTRVTRFRGKPFISRAFQQFSSRQTAQLRDLNRLAYDRKGKRRLRPEALEFMGSIGLAWLFADDGFLQKDRGKKDRVGLSTCCFTPRDLAAALRWFREKFGQSIWIGKDRVMRFGTGPTEKFCEAIAPFLPLSVRYKLPRHRSWPSYDKRIEAKLAPSPCSRYGAEVVEAGSASLKRSTTNQRYLAETRFCISVEKNRNFFTNGGLVANSDVQLDYLVWVRMQPDLESERHTYEGDKKVATLCSRMTVAGFQFDKQRCRELDEKLEIRAGKLLRRIRELTKKSDFNPANPYDIRKTLYKEFGAPIVLLTPTGLAGTGKQALEQFRNDDSKIGKLADWILRWRSAMKTKNTFLSVYMSRDGRVHAGWRVGPVTGRLGCRGPNLMNLPRYTPDKDTKIVDLCDRVRECYVSKPGYIIVYWDLRQSEARFAAHLSGDQEFIKACAGDVHAGNAKVIFPDIAAKGWLDGDAAKHPKKGLPYRDVAKNSGFAIYYLAGWETVYEKLTEEGFDVSPADCRAILDAVHGTYTTYYEFVAKNLAFVKEHGYMRTFGSKRIRWMGPFPSPTECANYPVQAGIADHMNERLLQVETRLAEEKLDAAIIAQVHDAGMVEVRADQVDDVKALVHEVFDPPVVIEGRPPFQIPIDLKANDRWSSL